MMAPVCLGVRHEQTLRLINIDEPIMFTEYPSLRGDPLIIMDPSREHFAFAPCVYVKQDVFSSLWLKENVLPTDQIIFPWSPQNLSLSRGCRSRSTCVYA